MVRTVFLILLIAFAVSADVESDETAEEIDELLEPIAEEMEEPELIDEGNYPSPRNHDFSEEEEYDDSAFQEAEESWDGMPAEMDYTYDFYMNLELIGKCREMANSACGSVIDDSNNFLHCLRSNATEFENVCAKNIGCLTDEATICGAKTMIDRDSSEWADCVLTHHQQLKSKCPPSLVCEATTAKLCGKALVVSHEAGHNCTAENKEQIEKLCAPESFEPVRVSEADIRTFQNTGSMPYQKY